jgi:outer membrane protein OmpA-like peptidoglycan-associated protein
MSNSNAQTMIDVPSTFRSLYWPVAIILALALALLWLTGNGPGGSSCKVSAPVAAAPVVVPPPPVPAPAPAPVVAAAAPVVAAPAPAPEPAKPAPVADLPPAQKVYFATSKYDVNQAGRDRSVIIIDYLKSHPNAKALLSGFHDPRGDKAANVELAMNRSRAVSKVIEDAGIDKGRIVIAQPAETTGDGGLAEARRVEISVQP